ncbi:hypothetical protein U6N30_08855 [Blastococcus brunescens]|uniref:Uncharacterized protein n=1 Tax=Blastococcus brunescens TaxID=1564165 RepID=A0ABZ1B4E8_9ACTN|nr:hypothetical protein [Blastococcus sp. BMG 8361]WRL65668.1 hypothetical protein U6N30_08855 [Blastococcus sp. BMG 8361]
MAAGQVVLGADHGEAHEVLHPIGYAGQLPVRGDAHQPVVRAGKQGIVGRVDAEAVHVLEGHVVRVGMGAVVVAVGFAVSRGLVSRSCVSAAPGEEQRSGRGGAHQHPAATGCPRGRPRGSGGSGRQDGR